MSIRSRIAFLVAAVMLALPLGALAADGAAVYKARCASCHGADGKGETPVGKKMELRDLGSADVQKQTDAQIEEITAKGKGKMPAFEGKLKPEEITALVAHMRSFKK